MNSITASLRVAISVVVFLMLCLAAAAWYSVDYTEKAVAELTDKAFPASQEFSNVVLSYQRARRYEKEYFVFLNNKERRDGYSKQWTTSVAATTKQLESIIANANKRFSRAESSRAQEWLDAVGRYSAGFSAVREQVDAGAITDGIAANAANGKNVDFVRPFDKEAPEFVDARVKQAQQATVALKSTLGTLRNGMFALIAVMMGYLVFLALTLPKKVTAPLAAFSEAAERMSKGDINNRVESGGITEFAKLDEAMERLRRSLGMMLERMRKG